MPNMVTKTSLDSTCYVLFWRMVRPLFRLALNLNLHCKAASEYWCVIGRAPTCLEYWTELLDVWRFLSVLSPVVCGKPAKGSRLRLLPPTAVWSLDTCTFAYTGEALTHLELVLG